MRKSWKEFKEFYRGSVLPKAWQDTSALLGWKPVALFFPVLYVLGFLGLAMYKGWNFAVDEIVANIFLSFIPVGIAAMFVLLVNLGMAPARLMENYRRFERDSTRLALLLQQLPLPRLDPEQKLRFQRALGGVEPRPVLIIYLDTPTSRAGPYAGDLVDAFRSGIWHAGMRGEREGYENCQGVSINIEAITHIRPAQQAVLDAFRSIGVQVTQRPGRDVGERVELIVGEM